MTDENNGNNEDSYKTRETKFAEDFAKGKENSELAKDYFKDDEKAIERYIERKDNEANLKKAGALFARYKAGEDLSEDDFSLVTGVYLKKRENSMENSIAFAGVGGIIVTASLLAAAITLDTDLFVGMGSVSTPFFAVSAYHSFQAQKAFSKVRAVRDDFRRIAVPHLAKVYDKTIGQDKKVEKAQETKKTVKIETMPDTVKP